MQRLTEADPTDALGRIVLELDNKIGNVREMQNDLAGALKSYSEAVGSATTGEIPSRTIALAAHLSLALWNLADVEIKQRI